MRVYADVPLVRVRQLCLDLLTAAWIYLWVRVGLRIFELVNLLQGPGRSLEGAGEALADRAGDLGEGVADVPVVGGALRAPFRAISDGGVLLQEAGVAQQSAVHTLALWLAVTIALLPILWAVIAYVPARLRWVREASAASRLRVADPDLALFALRALTNQPVAALAAVSTDPVNDYRRGEYAALASLELRSLGLRA